MLSFNLKIFFLRNNPLAIQLFLVLEIIRYRVTEQFTLAAFSCTSAVYEEGENTAGKSSASLIRMFNVVDELSPSLFGPLS